MFNKLISTYKERSDIESEITKKRNEFEDSIAHECSLADKLKEEEIVLREEAMLALDKADTSNVKVDDFNISRRTTVTRKIANLTDLWSFVMKKENRDIIERELGYDEKFDKQLFDMEVVSKDKKAVKTLIDNFYNLKGDLPDGTEDVETNYIAISKAK